MRRKKPKFLRKDTFKISRLGRRRKKKQKWRRPRGRHSKVREKRKGYPQQPSIGWRSPKEIRGLIKGLKPKVVFNVQDLNNLKENEIAIIGKVGKKRKIEIVKEALKRNIKLLNVTKKFIEEIEKEKEEKRMDEK